MHILNDRKGVIVDSRSVAEFFLTDTSDSTLLSLRWFGTEEPQTFERYRDRKEARDALGQLFCALSEGKATWILPESTYYFDEHIKRDARTKRKGGS